MAFFDPAIHQYTQISIGWVCV